MAVLARCDSCAKENEDIEARHWYHVERPNDVYLDVSTNTKSGTWLLCSESCLSEWAAERAPEVVK